MAPNKTPILSIGMIVKDEIRSIERCLRALGPLRKAISCELVIADTGSHDGTREVAEKYADILFDFEWIHDFSAARNAVLERCHGTWCLMVDADEYLDEDVKELCAFLKSPSHNEYEAINIIQRNYSSREMVENDCADFEALRLFRLDCGFRYSGTIHESIHLIGKLGYGRLPSVVLHHDGYAQSTNEEWEAHKARCERNQKLLKQKLANGGEDAPTLYVQLIESTYDKKSRKHYCELGYQYFASNQRKTLTMAEQALACRIIACWLFWKEERAFSFLQTVLPQIETHFLYLCDISFYAAQFYECEKEYEKALGYCRQYEKALQMYDKGTFDASHFVVSSPSCVYIQERLTHQVRLARLLYETGDADAAKKPIQTLSFVQLFQYESTFETYLQLLLDMGAVSWVPAQAATMFAALDLHEEGKQKEQAYTVVMRLLTKALAKERNMPSWRILETAPGEVGLSVQMMREKQPEQIEALLKQVNNWSMLSPLAVYYAIERRCRLPEAFFKQNIDVLQKLAVFFTMQHNTADSLLSWAGARQGEQSLPYVHFVLDYCTLILQKGGHSDDEWGALCRLFVHMASALNTQLYKAEFLANRSDWNILPSMQHFALLLLFGKKALEEKDELLFIKTLQEGVRVAPQMKHFVAFLSDTQHHLAAFPSAEMAALATQVKALLAPLNPQDPSVAQLKMSEAYRMVAPLVESKYAV